MNKDIDTDFTEIEKESNQKTYIIVIILYVCVIILSILLINGFKNQKDDIKNNADKIDQVENFKSDINKDSLNNQYEEDITTNEDNLNNEYVEDDEINLEENDNNILEEENKANTNNDTNFDFEANIFNRME